MAKYDVTKIFIGIFLMTFVSQGVLATMSCFVCVPDYDGNDQEVRNKAQTAENEIKRAKSDAGSCSMFIAKGIDQVNRANPDLKTSGCNRCVKMEYKDGDREGFVGRGCEKSGSTFSSVIAATDNKFSIHFCENHEYCNAAPSHFSGSVLSMVISLLVLSFKKFM